MGVPKKALRHKPAQRIHEEVAKGFFLKLEKLAETGKLGKEMIPAVDYLSRITRLELSELAKQRIEEFELGEKEALNTLAEVERELASGPQSEHKSEVAKLRAKLEEKVRGL